MAGQANASRFPLGRLAPQGSRRTHREKESLAWGLQRRGQQRSFREMRDESEPLRFTP